MRAAMRAANPEAYWTYFHRLMARTSPSAQRIIAIINFFAEHPGQSFTLTVLVRALKISSATCHTLLVELVEAGYLYRTSDKSYILGPTLASIGNIAKEHFSPLQMANPEMRDMADEFNVICTAYFVERNEIVIRAHAAAISQHSLANTLGARAKIRGVFAAIYAAWMPQNEADTWIDSLEPSPSPEVRQSIHQGMKFTREHGFCVGVRNVEPSATRRPPPKSVGDYADAPVSHLSAPAELDPDQFYSVAFIASPVFEALNQVAFSLCLVGFDSQLKGKEVERMGKRLREACERITRFILRGQPNAAATCAEKARTTNSVG